MLLHDKGQIFQMITK